jgi:hypothetical protein
MVEPAAAELAGPAMVTVIDTKVGVEFVALLVIDFLPTPPHPASVRQVIKAEPTKALILLICKILLSMQSS